MKNEKPNQRKYKVITFREYSYQPDYPSAIKEAYRMIEEIKKDPKFSSDLWFARIEYTYCIDRVRSFVFDDGTKKRVEVVDRPATRHYNQEGYFD